MVAKVWHQFVRTKAAASEEDKIQRKVVMPVFDRGARDVDLAYPSSASGSSGDSPHSPPVTR